MSEKRYKMVGEAFIMMPIYDGSKRMTNSEVRDRLNALEAEQDRLKAEMQYAILYIEAADHKAAYEVLTQALKGES